MLFSHLPQTILLLRFHAVDQVRQPHNTRFACKAGWAASEPKAKKIDKIHYIIIMESRLTNLQLIVPRRIGNSKIETRKNRTIEVHQTVCVRSSSICNSHLYNEASHPKDATSFHDRKTKASCHGVINQRIANHDSRHC